jgi:hypothetical protein
MEKPYPITAVNAASVVFTWTAPSTNAQKGGSPITGYNFVQTGSRTLSF